MIDESIAVKPEDIKPAVPDFVTKTKEYIKQHPEVIREVAGDELARIEKWLDTLPLGLGSIGKAKIDEFLGKQGNGSGVQEGTVNTPGREIKEETEGDRGTIPKERWNEILEAMVSMDDEGISPGKISDLIADDYGLELTHQQIWNYIDRYRRSLKAQEQAEAQERSEEDKAILRKLEIQKVQAEKWKKLTEELEATKKANIELEKKQAVHEALREKENPGRNKVGLIRWLIGKLY